MAKGAKDMLMQLGKSGGVMGKFYKGGQFTPGGGRAPKGGQRFGGLFGKALPKKEDAEKLKASTDSTKGIKPGQGKGIKDFLKGLGDGLAIELAPLSKPLGALIFANAPPLGALPPPGIN
jgi:hypothetical protein